MVYSICRGDAGFGRARFAQKQAISGYPAMDDLFEYPRRGRDLLRNAATLR